MPESNTPMALSLCVMNLLFGRRRHLIAKLLFTGRSKTEYLMPHFWRFHAQIDLRRRRRSANPLDHLAVHVDAQRLEITQLAVRTKYLLAGQKLCLRKARAHDPFESRGVAQHAQTQPCNTPPIHSSKSLLDRSLILKLPPGIFDHRIEVKSQTVARFLTTSRRV